MDRPLFIFDGNCGFCRIWIEYWKQLTGKDIDFEPSQGVGRQFPQIPEDAFARSVQLVRTDGSVASGARAVFETLGKQNLYESIPLLAPMSEAAYGFIARHRNFFYWVTRLTFGKAIEPARFALTQWLFLRALAVVYAIAFASLGLQVKGLLGAEGISPAASFLARAGEGLGAVRFFAVPTLFWINASDLVLQTASWLGFALALALLIGRLQRLLLIALYALYLSFALAGQQFLLFQWDSLLLEAGFLAIFLGGSLTVQRTVAWLFRWLVFRLLFLSGWVKLSSGDLSWRGLTALEFHYYTQPLPNAIAWYVAQLPPWFHRASTLAVLAIELGTPFLILLPRRIRVAGAWAIIGLQALIFLTGNYTFFNILTVAITLFLFDDQALRGIVRRRRPEPPAGGSYARIASAVLTAVVLPLGLARVVESVTLGLPEPIDTVLNNSAPFQVSNPYGLFATMTTVRPEIVIEGSEDGIEWRAYEFRYKPGDLSRAPRWVAPHQPRLDWQMWFAALRDYRSEPWIVTFLQRLLEGSSSALGLLAANPFPNQPPRFVRAQLYQYTFTDRAERAATGNWWRRELLGQYLPPITLRP